MAVYDGVGLRVGSKARRAVPLQRQDLGKAIADRWMRWWPVLLFELLLKAILQFGADFGDFHSCAYHEFAAEELMRLVFV